MSDIQGILGTPKELDALKQAFKSLQMQVDSIKIPEAVDLSPIYERLNVAQQQPLSILVNNKVVNSDAQISSISFNGDKLEYTFINGKLNLIFPTPNQAQMRLFSKGGGSGGGISDGVKGEVTVSDSGATWTARDVNGSTNGEGVYIGLLVTTATTNAALNSTMTVSYTNSDNTAGRTATVGASVDSFPATGVIGTLVFFKLAAGDRGVRSIQSITLAVSLAAGAVSLIAFRPIINRPVTLANSGCMTVDLPNPGIKLYSGTCLIPYSIASATTAQIITGTVTMIER